MAWWYIVNNAETLQKVYDKLPEDIKEEVDEAALFLALMIEKYEEEDYVE
jgi:hypothetical protein